MITPASQRRGILAGGSWIVDRVKLIDAWPPQDALATIVGQFSSNGGSAYNLLKNLSRFGADYPLEAVGLVGDDENGRQILEDCRSHRVDTRALHVAHDIATSFTDVMTVQSTGRRTFFHQRGANARLDIEHFDFSQTRAKHFHLGYLLLLDRLDTPGQDGIPRAATVLTAAREAGLKTSIDLVSEASDRFKRVVSPLLPQVDILFANDYETERLTGLSLREGEKLMVSSVERAARILIEAGVTEWVIIHFPEGVCAGDRSGNCVWAPSALVPAADIRGAAGAGDALASGVLHALHENWAMVDALELGVCAAAASLYHPTCSEGIGLLDDCLRLGRRLGYRTLEH